MLKNNKLNNKGFTIIEVMIVLAIAGLIILVVLLAVPALQRNGRNTAIKNDASAVAAAVSEYRSNNDGLLPGANNDNTSTAGTAHIIGTGVTDKTPADAKVQSQTKVSTGTAGPGAANGNTDPATITIATGFKCKSGSSNYKDDASSLTTDRRAAVVIYAVEQATGNPALKCIDA